MAYPTIADVRQYLSQIKDGSAELTALTAVLARAIAIVESAIGQLLGVPHFAFNATTPSDSERLITLYGGVAPLPLPPIQGAITSVKYESSFNVWTTIDPIHYVLRGSMLYFNATPLSVLLLVTAPWGFGDCPADVAEVMLEVCVNIWRSKDTGGMISQVGESGSSYLKTVASLTKQQTAVLQAYADQYRTIPV